jgi:hypothetical protein
VSFSKRLREKETLIPGRDLFVAAGDLALEFGRLHKLKTMKHRLKGSITLHRRYRAFGPNGGSMRWHIEVPESDEPKFFGNPSLPSDFGYTHDEERERESGENRRLFDFHDLQIVNVRGCCES